MLELLLNPQRRAEAVEEQAALREKLGHKIDRHPAQIKFLHGLERERIMMPAIEDVYSGVNTAPDILPILLDRLAEGYALQGKFREAANIAQSAERQAEYESKAKAVEAIGVKQCPCPPAANRRKPGDAKGENYPTSTPIEEIFDGRRFITLTRCSICKTISARLLQ